jgi:hypothetical protein
MEFHVTAMISNIIFFYDGEMTFLLWTATTSSWDIAPSFKVCIRESWMLSYHLSNGVMFERRERVRFQTSWVLSTFGFPDR